MLCAKNVTFQYKNNGKNGEHKRLKPGMAGKLSDANHSINGSN